MPALSIIVPVYNVENYLPRCLDSILNQTFKDFELILINDGSTDSSLNILKNYEEKDQRIIIIDKDNEGVSSARNEGLRLASGKYIGFVDADDWIDSRMYEELVEKLESSEAELSCCKVAVVESDSKGITFCDSSLPTTMSGEEFVTHIFGLPESVLTSIWNKLFIKDKIQEGFDESLRMDEDTKFLVHYCIGVKKAVFIDSVCYFYNRHLGSFTMDDQKSIIRGLSVRREIAGELLGFSVKAHEAAERSYLDRCCIGVAITGKERTSKEYQTSKHELLSYLKNNLGSVLLNKTMTWKLKVVVLFRALQLLMY